VSVGVALRQHLQKCLGLLQVGHIKALGEPPVDRGEQLTGLSTLALLLSQAGEAHGGPQFQGPSLPQLYAETRYHCASGMLSPGAVSASARETRRPLRVPPACHVHLTIADHNETQFEQAIKGQGRK
jgi:hypothetical protein